MFLLPLEPLEIEPSIPEGSGFTVRPRHQPLNSRTTKAASVSRGGLVDDMDFWSFYDGHPPV